MSGLRTTPTNDLIINRMPADYKTFVQSHNAGMAGLDAALPPNQAPTFREGYIVRSGPASYDFVVVVGGLEHTCTMLAGAVSNLYGASEAILPVEGSRVLVYIPQPYIRTGVVIGVLPPTDMSPPTTDTARTKTGPAYAGFFDLEAGGYSSELAYTRPLNDASYHTKLNASASRPLDLVPGTYAVVNEQGVGWAVTPLAATMKASSRAQLRVGLADDNVRLVSGHFQHFDAAGLLQSFNDGGFVTEERGITSYQCERLGFSKPGTEAFAPDAETTLDKKDLVTSFKKKKPRMTSRKRLQMFMGYLGDMINLFIGKPDSDPALDPETEEAENKDQGLLQVHADTSGRLMVRSAAGIMLERWDRIPVPKRIRQPWDPEGSRMEDLPDTLTDEDAKKPFNWDEKHPYGRALQLRDANAWRYLNAYWRLHNQSTAAGGKDFYLPEEQDLKTPDDQYDEPGKGSEHFTKNDKRHAMMGLEDDGSIVLRDAWGSEIIMRGGNIIINAAAQIEVRSGKSTVVMAGHDAILRGRQSVDISSTEHDVRIKANVNLHMLAEGRDEKGGGILIESKADGDVGLWEGKQGEGVISKGIVLKANKSRIFAQGKKVHLSGEDRVMLETFGEESGENNGQLLLSARKLVSSMKNSTSLTTGEGAALTMSKRSAELVGDSVSLVGGSSANVIKDSKAMIPLLWAGIGGAPYGDFQRAIASMYEYLQGTDWIMPYEPEQRADVKFTYRTIQEYGTVHASEIEGKDFYVYQPFWAFMATAGSQMVPAKPEGWKEYAIDGTKAWPGMGAGSYVKLTEEHNVASQDGVAKKRMELKDKGGTLTPGSFDEYEVIPH